MAENHPITISEGDERALGHCTGSAETIGLELNILGEHLQFFIGIRTGQLRLADVVPAARRICEGITVAVTKNIRRNGARIPCRAGCSACCHYLLPLAVPEAFRLMEEFAGMPESEQRLKQRLWLLTARRILTQEPPETVVGQGSEHEDEADLEQRAISDWYRNLKVSCPFLDQRVCTIYDKRPLSCREYFVTGSESACGGGCGEAKKVEVPVRMVEVLGQLAGDLEGTGVEAVMLPLVLLWHKENLERGKRTWPAREMVERFVEIVRETATVPAMA